MRVDTRGMPAGIYEVWIDMLMERRNWMALHGAVPVAATLRIEAFSHDIAVNTDVVRLPSGGTAELSGTVRNACGKPWPGADGGEPRLGARLFRRPANGEPVREFRAPLGALPTNRDEAIGFNLVLDSKDLERGDYELSIDVVKESAFWLEEKGATPRVIPVTIE